nr:relaxase MobL [Mycoplasmopsis agalactiae]
MTLNPGQLGIDNQMVDKNEWNEILNKHMKSLLKANKLDPNKIEGYWALHANSKYPHIHLAFFEKETNHNNNYRQSGKFSSKSVERFKYLFENSIKTQAEYQNLFSLKIAFETIEKKLKNYF